MKFPSNKSSTPYLVEGSTDFTMVLPTAVPANSSRSFTSVKQAADENADSRVQAGIHFRFACEAGQEMGDKIGLWIVKNYLQPLNADQVANTKE